jgi:hypothetical protein
MFPSKSLLASIGLFLALSAAEASQLPDYQVTGDALFNLSPPDRLSLSRFGSIPLADARFGSVSFAASGTPSPSLVAGAEIGPSTTPIIFGRRAGFLTYFFEILGPSGAVPVLIDVAGGATAFASPGASFAVESRWDLLDSGASLAGDDIRSGQLSGNFNESFDRTVILTLATNHVYSVFMLADAGAAATLLGSHATANAFVDPVFSLAPGVDPLAYSFDFSEGIGNSSLVPEPGTLVLLIAGVLFLGLLRLRMIA